MCEEKPIYDKAVIDRAIDPSLPNGCYSIDGQILPAVDYSADTPAKLTEAMIQAGAAILWEGLPEEFSWQSSYALALAKEVYLAMDALREREIARRAAPSDVRHPTPFQRS